MLQASRGVSRNARQWKLRRPRRFTAIGEFRIVAAAPRRQAVTTSIALLVTIISPSPDARATRIRAGMLHRLKISVVDGSKPERRRNKSGIFFCGYGQARWPP